MGKYKNIINPFTGGLQKVFNGNLITFKAGVATEGDLPTEGNLVGDARIANDTGHLYIWDGSVWQDEGDIIDLTWDALSGKPSSTPANIDDAVSKKHTQNSDTKLDNGESNEVTSADLRGHLDSRANPHEVKIEQLDLATGTNASDVDDAVTKKHEQNTDTKSYININTPDLSATGVINYTLILTDDGKLIDMDKADALTLTVPANADVAFPIGTTIAIRQKGAGQITITPVTGVTVDSQDGLITTAQHAMASILKVATDTWVAVGSLEA